MVHEELHGFSLSSQFSYSGIGSVLEEVGTELNAQRITRDLTKAAHLPRAYERDIVRVRDAVRGALSSTRSLSNAEVEAMIADAHAKRVLTAGGAFMSPQDHIAALVSGFNVTAQERAAIKSALENLKP